MLKDKRYNVNRRRHIELREGEKFCPKCDGRGIVPLKKRTILKRSSTMLQCNVCLGSGVLDWVEAATGKNQRNGVKLCTEGCPK